MKLLKISLANFKNYANETISFGPKINLLYGRNGSGKTNLLDSINYLALGKSYFGLTDKHIVMDNMDFIRVSGELLDDSGSALSLTIKYKLGQKKEIHYQKRKLTTASEIIGKLPIVLIAPNDIKLVNDDSKERRDFVNRILCQSDKNYLSELLTYNRVLSQKNALLKSDTLPDKLLLESYNDRLIQSGKIIFESRQKFVTEYLSVLVKYYELIAGTNEKVNLAYLSQYDCDHIVELYRQVVDKEILYKRPLIGIHKDDYLFNINNKELKKYGSQGQIKSFLYALRVAEYLYLKEHLNMKPILILDDFFEKLDKQRLTQLINLVNNDTFDQVFLSDTELERSKKIFNENRISFASYFISDGHISKQEVKVP